MKEDSVMEFIEERIAQWVIARKEFQDFTRSNFMRNWEVVTMGRGGRKKIQRLQPNF